MPKKRGKYLQKQPASSINGTVASFPHFNFVVRTRSSNPYRKTKTRAQNRKQTSLLVTRLLPLLQIKLSTNAKVTKFYKRTGKTYVKKIPASSRIGFALASLLHFKFVVRTRSSEHNAHFCSKLPLGLLPLKRFTSASNQTLD
jgi:hypothetical protein